MKIDYSIWPLDLLDMVGEQDRLPDILDAGYRVLLDKDGITDSLPRPTYKSYIPAKPSEKEYSEVIEEFWWTRRTSRRQLHRGELLFAKSFMFEHEIRLEVLTRLLGWLIEIEHNWSIAPSAVRSPTREPHRA